MEVENTPFAGNSPKVKRSINFCSPGNAGTAELATNLDIEVNDFDALKKAVIQNNIDLVVVGPEDPLVNGIHDFFLDDPQLKNIPLIGPQKLGLH